LGESSDFERKLVETRLGSRVLLESTFAVALLAFRSHSVIAEVTPKEGSPASLPQTVLRPPLKTAVEVLPAFEPGKKRGARNQPGHFADVLICPRRN
jgi:hypothetical protein